MLLPSIQRPQDLKGLSVPQLTLLAQEIRRFLIEELSKTGGHLAPNLGVVELTLALHYLFDSPKDKIIWDVGHQSYVHKMLTGRRGDFSSLRQFKGLSGFPKRAESPHDIWETGHSSTSLSAAMGMVTARDLKGENYHVIPVIGDGALTGGMALEALNHIGHEKRKMLIILNDNEMSISPNVGALNNYLGKIRTARTYARAKEEMDHLLRRIPAIGEKLAKTAEKLKDGLKYAVLPGVLFEELGLTYLGPVDGHSFEELLGALKQAKDLNGSILLHVKTIKGKGYSPAEADADTFHGVSPYKIESGEVLKKEGPPSYSAVAGRTLVELAEKDERIVTVTAAMLGGTGLKAFADRFPHRFFDVGIAEQHATTFCGALSIEGMLPVFAVYSTFLQRAYDQVIHDICRQDLHVVFAVDRAGLVGADGETHQGVFDIAFLRTVPNITIMMPRDESQLRQMLFTGLYHVNGPVVVRYPRGNGKGTPLDVPLEPIPVGKAEVLRQGRDVCIAVLGPLVDVALEAAKKLQLLNIDTMVVDARFAKPLDEELFLQVAQTGLPIFTLEEASLMGGFGSSILELLSDAQIFTPVHRLGIPDTFIEHGSPQTWYKELGLTAEHLAEQVTAIVQPSQEVWHG